MYDSPETFLSALLSGVTGQGGAPLNIAVTLTSSDEVLALRAQVAELQGQLSELQTSYNRVQYLYMCEVQLNWQLQDILKGAGIPFPRRLCTSGSVSTDFPSSST